MPCLDRSASALSFPGGDRKNVLPLESAAERKPRLRGLEEFSVKESTIAIILSIGCAQLAAADEPIDFAHDVLPILKSRCAACHTDGTYEGDFSMDTRASRSRRCVPGSIRAWPGNPVSHSTRIPTSHPSSRDASRFHRPSTARTIPLTESWGRIIDRKRLNRPGRSTTPRFCAACNSTYCPLHSQ